MTSKPDVSTARVSMALHGPDVSIGDAAKAGRALVEVLAEVSRTIGAPSEWKVSAVYFQCDGCGLRRPDRPAPGEGWTHSNGDDFCPSCTPAPDAPEATP